MLKIINLNLYHINILVKEKLTSQRKPEDLLFLYVMYFIYISYNCNRSFFKKKKQKPNCFVLYFYLLYQLPTQETFGAEFVHYTEAQRSVLPSGSLILRPAADFRSTLRPELNKLVNSSRGLVNDLEFVGLYGNEDDEFEFNFL